LEKQSIILISCGHFEKDLIDIIVEDITREFHYPVIFKEYDFDISNFYYPARRQYDANSLLKVVSEMSYPGSFKKIGLFRVDLFIPILTYIFGQAILNGDSGIVSLYRLRNELYGLKQSKTILNERLRKVIIHEIGHMFGLIHCQNPVCVMRSSTYVEDIDQKNQNLCIKCRTMIGLD
jgi:archaemetzincin